MKKVIPILMLAVVVAGGCSLLIKDLAQPLVMERALRPFPEIVWDLDFSHDGKLLALAC